ncbi:MAG: nucleotidyltransferase family protein [Magnetococcales bacterium]|nr:nucleotidyltransferase family protein [Magnetococcales bacterium]
MPHLTPDSSAAHWLLTAWLTPATFPAMPSARQEVVLRLARANGLLAALEKRLEQTQSLAALPSRVQSILEGARMIALDRERSIRWEVGRIQRAFFGTGLPVILLKGAAYHMRNLPFAQGRLTGDVDLLLSRADLPMAEQALKAWGWHTALPDDYDQRYYREWMHELPPMRHRDRLSELDLHHAILPRTGRLVTDSAPLLENAQEVPGHPGIWTLAPADMLLHAAVHLFHDGAFQRMGLRDLLDLDGLLRHFGERPGFWDELLQRAIQLNLIRPLDHALWSCAHGCATPIPETTRLQVAQKSQTPWHARVMRRYLIPRVILPRHPDRHGPDPLTAVAAWLLYTRSHWLRMPMNLLIPHLARKWTRRWSFNVWHRRTV